MNLSAPQGNTPSPLGEPLVDAAAVAAFLGIHVASVYRLAGRAGGIPVVQIGEGVRRFRPADVRDFVERRTRAPQVRASRSQQLLGAVRRRSQNELATPRRKSVTRTQEPSTGSKPPEPEARR